MFYADDSCWLSENGFSSAVETSLFLINICKRIKLAVFWNEKCSSVVLYSLWKVHSIIHHRLMVLAKKVNIFSFMQINPLMCFLAEIFMKIFACVGKNTFDLISFDMVSWSWFSFATLSSLWWNSNERATFKFYFSFGFATSRNHILRRDWRHFLCYVIN